MFIMACCGIEWQTSFLKLPTNGASSLQASTSSLGLGASSWSCRFKLEPPNMIMREVPMSVQRQQKNPWRSGVHWIEWPMAKKPETKQGYTATKVKVSLRQAKEGWRGQAHRKSQKRSSNISRLCPCLYWVQKQQLIMDHIHIVSIQVIHDTAKMTRERLLSRNYSYHEWQTKGCKNCVIVYRAKNSETQASANVIGCWKSVAKTCIHDNLPPTIYQPHKRFIAS